jgi:N-acylneuraminate cytidylyltransferase
LSKTIAIIPARGGSKGIPKKNIKLFCGKPLIYYVLSVLQQSIGVDNIYVSTDDAEIIKNVLEIRERHYFKKVFPIVRSKENSSDKSTSESVLEETINQLKFINDNYINDDDKIILVQCTNPFLRVFDIEQAMFMINYQHYDSIISCCKMKRFLWKENDKGIAEPINYKYWERPFRQEFDSKIFLENGSFYINSVANIKRFHNRLSGRIGIHEMPEYSATEIDTEDDWILAENIYRKHLE